MKWLALGFLCCATVHCAWAAAKNPDTYTYLNIADANTLDPAWSYDTPSSLIIHNIYETLFEYQPGSMEKLVPLLAQKAPSRENGLISADHLTYTIPIRHGVRFHDGSLMTPEDARYSLLRFLLTDRASGPSQVLLQPLLGYTSTRDEQGRLLPNVWEDANRAVSARGDSLILRLPRPYAPFLNILAATTAVVVSKDWAAKNGAWDGSEAAWSKFNNPSKETSPFFDRANGTGPFKLERWDRKNKEVLLIRNDAYWRKPAKLRRVVVKNVPEFITRKLMLQAGDADAILADRTVFSQLQDLPGVRIIDDLPVPLMNPGVFFTFHISSSANPAIGSGRLDGEGIPQDFFADKDVRQAFAYAFDYTGYIADVFRGKGSQATGCIPRGLAGHDARGPIYRLDLAQSKDRFKKAWGGRLWETGFRFTMAYNSGNASRQTICQILKRNIEGLNPKFKIDVRGIEWPAYLDASISGKLPVFVLGWPAEYPDPNAFAFPFLHSKGYFPSVQRFNDPRMDRLVEEAMAENDPAKRVRLYIELQRLEFEEVPHLLVLDTVLYRTQRDWVKGWAHYPMASDSPYGGYFYPLWKE